MNKNETFIIERAWFNIIMHLHTHMKSAQAVLVQFFSKNLENMVIIMVWNSFNLLLLLLNLNNKPTKIFTYAAFLLLVSFENDGEGAETN